MYSSRTDAMRSTTAQQALSVASQNIAILNGMSWSGCDWCCGGGRENMNHEQEVRRIALRTLSNEGELPIIWCNECGHYKAERDTNTCIKCNGGA